MMNTNVIDGMIQFGRNQQIDLVQYSMQDLSPSQIKILNQHYGQNLTDKQIKEASTTPTTVMKVFRERTKATEDLKRICILNCHKGVGFNPDPNH